MPAASGIAHPHRVAGADAAHILVARAARLGIFPDEMTRDPAAEPPAAALGLLVRGRVQRRASDVGIGGEARLHRVEHRRQVGAQRMLRRIVADRIAAADIGLPRAEYRAQIEEDDVVLADHAIGCRLAGDAQCVDPGADDPVVPMLGDAEVARGDRVDVALDLELGPAGGDQGGGFDRVEQGERLALGGNQRRECRVVGPGHRTYLLGSRIDGKHGNASRAFGVRTRARCSARLHPS